MNNQQECLQTSDRFAKLRVINAILAEATDIHTVYQILWENGA